MRPLSYATMAAPILLTLAGRSAAADDPIVTAARARQQAVKSISIEFKVKDVIAKGGLFPNLHNRKNPKPAEEMVFESNNRLVFDGSKFRVENNHFVIQLLGGKLIQIPMLSVTNEAASKLMAPRGPSNDGVPMCIVDPPTLLHELKTPDLAPVWMTFRAADAELAPVSFAELKPTGATLVIDGALCQEYAAPSRSKTVIKYWADPAKDYVVRRIDEERTDRRLERTIAYRKNAITGWVPESWIDTTYSLNGDWARTCRADVTSLTINEPQPADQFDLAFPVGANVSDQRDGKHLKYYRVETDGSLRELALSELVPPAKPKPWLRRYQWWLGGVWLAVAVGLLIYLSRKVWTHRTARRLGFQA